MKKFKEVHRDHSRATEGLEDPAPLQDQLDRMKEETEILDNQIDEARNKISNIVYYYYYYFSKLII